MKNFLIALLTVPVMGLSAPSVTPDSGDVAAFAALVEHLVAAKFPTSHAGRQVALDIGSIAQLLGGANVAEVRSALVENRPIETLGADPAKCRKQKCWNSRMYMELVSWEKTDTGYEAVTYVLVRVADSEDYHGSMNRYSLERQASGWSVTLVQPILRS